MGFEDAKSFFYMMCILDNETPFMMYESGERIKSMKLDGKFVDEFYMAKLL